MFLTCIESAGIGLVGLPSIRIHPSSQGEPLVRESLEPLIRESLEPLVRESLKPLVRESLELINIRISPYQVQVFLTVF